MSTQKKKIAELHRRVERERNRKEKMYQSASEALNWWSRTNALSEKIMKQCLGVLQMADSNRLTFGEWLGICPWKWIARSAEKLMKLFNKKNIWLETSVYTAQFQRWQVQRLLGDAKTYSVEEMSGKLEVPVAVIEDILKEIMEEKEKNGVQEETPTTPAAYDHQRRFTHTRPAPIGKPPTHLSKSELTVDEQKQRILRETQPDETKAAPDETGVDLGERVDL